MPPPLYIQRNTEEKITTDKPAFVMGIVNCTPDSFWEKSRFYGYNNETSCHFAAEQALLQFEAGADIVDLGAESTRPGSCYVSEKEEMNRLIPVIQEIRRHSAGVLSIDTRKLEVIKAAFEVGADILNDISALEDDPFIGKWAAMQKIPVILMHKRGLPIFMQTNTEYTNPIEDIAQYIADRVKYAVSVGISKKNIIIDPGIGFGKNTDVNSLLIQKCDELFSLVQQKTNNSVSHLLMALSRKSCIGEITNKPVELRLSGTITANIWSVLHGATMIRVHDVAEAVDSMNILKRFVTG